ncbi:MAG: hypothetical protein J6V77_03685, partial [Clostridia bacterium]|nr:hypothetical protein [Clostridia bacterium]
MREKQKLKSRFISAMLIFVLATTMVILTACNKEPLVFDNPMVFAELKPESYTITTNGDGEIIGYKLNSDTPER